MSQPRSQDLFRQGKGPGNEVAHVDVLFDASNYDSLTSHWICRMTEGGSVITESPKGGITECHMPIQIWWTAI